MRRLIGMIRQVIKFAICIIISTFKFFFNTNLSNCYATTINVIMYRTNKDFNFV